LGNQKRPYFILAFSSFSDVSRYLILTMGIIIAINTVAGGVKLGYAFMA